MTNERTDCSLENLKRYLVKVEFVAINIKSYVTWEVGGSQTAPKNQTSDSMQPLTYKNTVRFLNSIPVEFRCQRLKVTYVELPQTVKMSGLDPNFMNFIVAIYASLLLRYTIVHPFLHSKYSHPQRSEQFRSRHSFCARASRTVNTVGASV